MDIPYYRERGRWLAAHLQAGHDPPDAPAPETVVDFVEEVTSLRNARRILELGCGWGRYSHELAARAYRIIATDVSDELIALAQETAMRRRRPLAFLDEPLHRLDFPPYFDLVLCFESTLPLNVPSEPAARAALTRVAELLRPGGQFLFGSSAWMPTPPATETRYLTPDGRVIETTRYDDETGMRTRTLRTPDDTTYSTSYQHWSADDIEQLLDEAGFAVHKRWHRYVPDAVWRPGADRGILWLTQRVR